MMFRLLASSVSCVVIALASSACPPAEGEGEGDAGEGEGEGDAGEGEGDTGEGEGDVAGEGEGEGGVNTISWTVDGTPIEATVNTFGDFVSIPVAGTTFFSLSGNSANFQEQMTILLQFPEGESIPAGTYTCGSLPNNGDQITFSMAHTAVVATASDNSTDVVGACSLVLDTAAAPGARVTGSFTATQVRTAGGADFAVTAGVFDIQDL